MKSQKSKTDWVIKDLDYLWGKIDKQGKKYGLTYFEPQFELVNEEYLSYLAHGGNHGMPSIYSHWSFGKNYLEGQKSKGTIMEMIINSNPCICYLLSSNSYTTMAAVMAHASVGHASVFKNNYLFKEWTNPETVLAFFESTTSYVKECERKYGVKRVEEFIDVMHAVQNISFDKYPSRQLKTDKQKLKELTEKNIKDDAGANFLFDYLKLYNKVDEATNTSQRKMYFDRSDNFLRMLQRYGGLPEWQNVLINFFIYMNQYFFGQIQTKLLNEGYADFWEDVIMNDLIDNNTITNGMMLEHIHMKSMVEHQSNFSQYIRIPNSVGKTSYEPIANPYYNNINPYYLGFNIFKEIKRVCIEQDKESLEAVPKLKEANWIEAVQDAMENYKDDSLVNQFLTPNLVRKLKIAYVAYPKDAKSNVKVKYAHDDIDFSHIKRELTNQYNMSSRMPTIESYVLLEEENLDRIVPELFLVYTPYRDLDLEPKRYKLTLKLITDLWKGKVRCVKNTSLDSCGGKITLIGENNE